MEKLFKENSSLTGLGSGGPAIKDPSFAVPITCIPGSSHGGIGQTDFPSRDIYAGPAYDKEDTTSLLGGSGGEVMFFYRLNVLRKI